MNHEPDFYSKIYKETFRGDDKKTYQLFAVPIGNAKSTEKYSFTQQHQ